MWYNNLQIHRSYIRMRLLDGWLLFAVIGIALGANEMPLPVVFMYV